MCGKTRSHWRPSYPCGFSWDDCFPRIPAGATCCLLSRCRPPTVWFPAFFISCTFSCACCQVIPPHQLASAGKIREFKKPRRWRWGQRRLKTNLLFTNESCDILKSFVLFLTLRFVSPFQTACRIFFREMFFYQSKNYLYVYTGQFENLKARTLKSIYKK